MEIKNDGAVSALLKDVALPKMIKARQIFPRPKIKPEDIPEAEFNKEGNLF